jgi:integrase/recombinase XerC
MSEIAANCAISPAGASISVADALRIVREQAPERVAELYRDIMRDKSYEAFPLGREVRRYLMSQRKRFTDSTMRTYEHVLVQLVRAFPDLVLEDFELPLGAERIEEFMDDRWGAGSRAAYNVNHSIISEFFKWHRQRERMRTNPMELVGRARKPQVYRTTFTSSQHNAIIASAESLRDRLALRLLLDYGIRKGALQKVQFKHFDHQRRRLTVFTKGQAVRAIPIPEPPFWMDLGHHILDVAAEPAHYLMALSKPIPRVGVRRFPDRAMSSTAMHRWWYARLNDAGVVAKGTTAGEKMHKARHTAGQRVLDATGDLKLVQKLLGHASIQTTGDVYVDYDIDQWAARMSDALKRSAREDAENED